jgi:hypothetical protein
MRFLSGTGAGRQGQPRGAGCPEGVGSPAETRGVRRRGGPGDAQERLGEVGEKEAGAAGGESGARAHGPALGGEAGSVLIRKLIHK